MCCQLSPHKVFGRCALRCPCAYCEMGNSATQDSRKTKNKIGGRRPEGCTTDTGVKRLEQMNWG